MTSTLPAPAYSARNSDRLDVHPDQVLRWDGNPRKHFDEANLAELADSIAAHGLLEPPVVRPVPGDDPVLSYLSGGDFYYLIAGERRWRACKLAGLTTMPVTVRYDVDDKQALELALVENLQRQDLDPIEEAEGYRQLNRIVGLKQAAIAAAVKRSQPAIANAMRLLDLPEDVQDRIRVGDLSVSHGVALARYKAFPALASELSRLAVEGGVTSKSLADTLPAVWHLADKGLIRHFGGRTAFDETVCHSCPFGAYVAQSEYHNFCLKPDHYDELQVAAMEEQRIATEARLAAAREQGQAAPALSDLHWGDYQRLDYLAVLPDGCSDDCPCRGVGLNDAGEPVAICTDRKRYDKLRSAKEKAEKAAKRAAGRDRAGDVAAAVDEHPALDQRVLAVVAVAALQHVSRLPVLKAAEYRAPGVFAEWKAVNYGAWRDATLLDLLASYSVEELTRLIAEAVLRSEIGDAAEGYQGRTPWTDWFLRQPAPAKEAADD